MDVEQLIQEASNVLGLNLKSHLNLWHICDQIATSTSSFEGLNPDSELFPRMMRRYISVKDNDRLIICGAEITHKHNLSVKQIEQIIIQSIIIDIQQGQKIKPDRKKTKPTKKA